ncbi:E3 ubiquitin-protein ligase DTX3L-like [Acipenser ruthenus]|uniref:E3 ubiquitin-protein ligase DTX3L-like n=1 Tax=Acipenser ruthenus TaxID=7906 RepID=UPI0027424418|nr:E3 ubiquitin-protein ligase DTX3L-like [Acipenser ruthenus]
MSRSSEIFTDVTMTIDLNKFQDEDEVCHMLLGRNVTKHNRHLEITGSFHEIENVFLKLQSLKSCPAAHLLNSDNRGPLYPTRTEPVKVDRTVMKYIDEKYSKELDKVRANMVSITRNCTRQGYIVDFISIKSTPGPECSKARERFITFYQKIATNLQVKTLPIKAPSSVTRFRDILEEELPRMVIGTEGGSLKLTGNYLDVMRAEQIISTHNPGKHVGNHHSNTSDVDGTSKGSRQSRNKASSSSPVKEQHKAKEEACPICLDEIKETERETLARCQHSFCRGCLKSAFDNKPACPVCGVLYGEVKGTQPRNGTMSISQSSVSLPGYEKHGTLVIKYDIPSGVQGDEHPSPGQRYWGASRTAYLPDSALGRKVLALLRRAFDQQLIFTIGTSSTTGMSDVVTWNDIHHKTSTHGGPTRYGYPDPDYLRRVQDELKAKGIY